ncbi:tetratricopeptide repeat protein [Luteibaculum oceani]|nr:tetratricopeptide repeat protein [Luteibaculum oceani]
MACGSEQNYSDNTTADNQEYKVESSKEDSLNLVLRNDPNNIDAYLERGNLKFQDSRFQGALGDADRALTIDSLNPEALVLKGESQFALEEFYESQKTFEKCLEYNPKYVPCYEKLAEISLLRKNYEKAIGYVNDALRLDEQNYYPYYLKGWIYQEKGDSALAASSYQTSVELNPKFYDGYIMLGSLYYNANHPLCVQYFNTALELEPTSTEALYFMGMYYQNNEESAKATQAYNRMRAIDATDLRPWYNTGFIHLTQNLKFDSAVYYFNQVLIQDDQYYAAWYNRGLAHLKMGNKKQAIADMETAVGINPDYTIAIKALNRLTGQ